MTFRSLLTTLLCGSMLLGAALPGRAQELYYGDDDDTSPEEYYLEGIGYGDDDYGSYSAEDTSYSGLYSPSADQGNDYDYEPAESGGTTLGQGDDGYALPAGPLPGAGNADADWFSMSGVALLEVVGDEGSRILITRNSAGKIGFLKAGESVSGAFKVTAVGSEQARVEPEDGGASKVVPVLHKQVPVDALMTAVARQQGLRVVISKQLDREVPFEDGMTNLEDGFAPMLADMGMFAKRFDDVLIVREAPFLSGGGAFDPESAGEAGEGVDLASFRGNGDELRETISKALPAGIEGGPDSLPAGVTAFLGGTDAAEALHYLNLALGTDMRVKEAAEKTPVALSPEKADKLYKQAVALAKAGDLKGSGKRLLYICRKGSKDPAHFQALGKVYWRMGRTRHAVKAWRAGLKLDPQNTTSRRLLVKAKRALRAQTANS